MDLVTGQKGGIMQVLSVFGTSITVGQPNQNVVNFGSIVSVYETRSSPFCPASQAGESMPSEQVHECGLVYVWSGMNSLPLPAKKVRARPWRLTWQTAIEIPGYRHQIPVG